VSAWLADLPAEPDRRVIAVSHGVTGRVLRGLYAGLGPQGMAALPAPQDAVFQLSAGEIARFDCAALDASPS
jgi:broad specificity phosphatase PhoE